MSHRPPDDWLDIPIDVAERLLELQLSFADALDSKIGLFVSVASALLPVLPAVVAIRNKGSTFWVGAFMFASVVAFACVAGFGVYGLWSRRWALGPDLDFILRVARRQPREAAPTVASGLRSSLQVNRDGYSSKLLAFKWSFGALIAEAIVVYVGLLLLLAGL